MGTYSVAAPIVFAVLYALTFLFYVSKSINHPCLLFLVATFFCVSRVVTNAMLARILVTVFNDPKMGAAQQIIYDISFLGLLCSMYYFVLTRFSDTDENRNPLLQLVTSRVFGLGMIIDFIFAIVSSTYTFGTKPSKLFLGDKLRKGSDVLTLILTIFFALEVLLLARQKLGEGRALNLRQQSQDARGIYTIIVIATLLLTREAFFTATMNNLLLQFSDRLYYPLAETTEFIAVCLFAVSGLVGMGRSRPSTPRSDRGTATRTRTAHPRISTVSSRTSRTNPFTPPTSPPTSLRSPPTSPHISRISIPTPPTSPRISRINMPTPPTSPRISRIQRTSLPTPADSRPVGSRIRTPSPPVVAASGNSPLLGSEIARQSEAPRTNPSRPGEEEPPPPYSPPEHDTSSSSATSAPTEIPPRNSSQTPAPAFESQEGLSALTPEQARVVNRLHEHNLPPSTIVDIIHEMRGGDRDVSEQSTS